MFCWLNPTTFPIYGRIARVGGLPTNMEPENGIQDPFFDFDTDPFRFHAFGIPLILPFIPSSCSLIRKCSRRSCTSWIFSCRTSFTWPWSSLRPVLFRGFPPSSREVWWFDRSRATKTSAESQASNSEEKKQHKGLLDPLSQ